MNGAGAAPQGELVAEGLAKTYRRRGGAAIHVLQDCSFRFEPGKLHVVMGTSGCGKSTLANLLAGYIEADAGHIEMDGQAVSGPSMQRLMVFQETALWPWMTALDNVAFGPLARKSLSRKEALRQASELLERFGLGAFKTKYPGQLSGGMQRRVELAQALINSPRVMILDEPFRGLDVMSRELMQEYFLKVFEGSALTTVFVTSELEEALFLADRIHIMGEPPSRIVKVIEVDLPRPRDFSCLVTSRYRELKEEALRWLYAQHPEEEVSEESPGATRP